VSDAKNILFLIVIALAIAAWEAVCYWRGGWSAMITNTVRRACIRWPWVRDLICVGVGYLLGHWFG
jgi:hypothetical protein